MSERTFENNVRLTFGAVFGFFLATFFAHAATPDKPPMPMPDLVGAKQSPQQEPQDIVAKSLTIVDDDGNPRILLYLEPDVGHTPMDPTGNSVLILRGPEGEHPRTMLLGNRRMCLINMTDRLGRENAALYGSGPFWGNHREMHVREDD